MEVLKTPAAPAVPTREARFAKGGAPVVLGRLVPVPPVCHGCRRPDVPASKFSAHLYRTLCLGGHTLPVALKEQEEPDILVFLGQVQQGRADPQGQHLGGGVEPLFEAIEGRGGEDLGFGDAGDTEGGLGDNPEHPFAADEQAVQVGARGVLGHCAGGHGTAVGQHHLQRHDLFAHGTEGRRAVSYPVGGNGTADGSDGHAVGVVPGHQPVFGQGILQVF